MKWKLKAGSHNRAGGKTAGTLECCILPGACLAMQIDPGQQDMQQHKDVSTAALWPPVQVKAGDETGYCCTQASNPKFNGNAAKEMEPHELVHSLRGMPTAAGR